MLDELHLLRLRVELMCLGVELAFELRSPTKTAIGASMPTLPTR
jgi:hypothetical protein